MSVEILNFGGIIRSLTAPDRNGRFDNVVLAYDSLEEYENDTQYLGALIGRCANRIAGARFELDGEVYDLAANNGANHLHGGYRGFNRMLWEARPVMAGEGPSLLLEYVSEDGEEGYPGRVTTKVCYTLTDANRLMIACEAVSDRATPVNFTSHSYFNLSGNTKRDILSHCLEINADYFTPVDSALIPTGELLPVVGTPFDFRSAKEVGKDIDADDRQMAYGSGFDHNFVLNPPHESSMGFVARLSDPVSGRVMTVHSTEPGVQFYSGNQLCGSTESGGKAFGRRTGLCLETQHFPDSPNQPRFPSTLLRPGETWMTTTTLTFDVAG